MNALSYLLVLDATDMQNSNSDHRLHSSQIPNSGGGGGGNFMNGVSSAQAQAVVGAVPPVPPRPASQSRVPIYYSGSPYRPIMPSYSPFSSSMYSNHSSPYNSYSSFSSYPYASYNRVPPPYGTNGEQPSFAELAEESSAPAFHSIESFVHAFGSISSMLESTFHAVYSTFRTVVEVADHLTRVKQVFQSFAIFRFLRWMFRRILYLIGISKMNPEQIESVWNSVVSESINKGNDASSKKKRTSTWPILLFLGFIFAGPYFIWKLIASFVVKNTAQPNSWATGEQDHYLALANYDFEPANSRELKLKKGDRIRLAPKEIQPQDIKGWILASDGTKIGLVPLNYIKAIGGKVTGSQNQNNFVMIPEETSDSSNIQISRSSSPSLSRSSSQSTIKWNDGLNSSTEEL